MNDNELDDLLNRWKAPEARASWRSAVRQAIEPSRRPAMQGFFTRWRLAAAAAAVIAAFIVATPTGLPRRSTPPFIVESKVTYSESGGPPWYAATVPDSPLITSFNQDGTEVILSWSSPDHAFQAALWKLRIAISVRVDWITGRFSSVVAHLDPRIKIYEEDDGSFAVVYPSTVTNGFVVGRRDDLVRSGCRSSLRGWNVIGQEEILEYATVILQEELGGGSGLLTVWMAPELSCFALRATLQAKQPDGSWKLLSEKNALKVTLN